jgi:hypothetical protein
MSVITLRESRKKAVVVFTEFTRLYKMYSSAFYCFFEGEDSKYYGVRIDNIVRCEKSIFLDCKGKEGVLGIHKLLTQRKHYADVKTAYFIDRDFDISIYDMGLTGIYETPCYSIENFYTSVSCFSKILKSEFKLIESDEDFEKCIFLYKKLQEEFHDAIETLNIWYACQKDKSVELTIQDLKLSDYVQITLSAITCLYSINDLYNKYQNAEQILQEDLDIKQSYCLSRDRQKSFRGKFEIEFLVVFLQQLALEANKRHSTYFTKKLHVTLNVSPKTVISILSQYADTPSCLHSYLETFVKTQP